MNSGSIAKDARRQRTQRESLMAEVIIADLYEKQQERRFIRID